MQGKFVFAVALLAFTGVARADDVSFTVSGVLHEVVYDPFYPNPYELTSPVFGFVDLLTDTNTAEIDVSDDDYGPFEAYFEYEGPADDIRETGCPIGGGDGTPLCGTGYLTAAGGKLTLGAFAETVDESRDIDGTVYFTPIPSSITPEPTSIALLGTGLLGLGGIVRRRRI